MESSDAAESSSPAETKHLHKKKFQKSKCEGKTCDESIGEEKPVSDAGDDDACAVEMKKAKKKKKKKRKSCISSDEGSKGEDEVITITYSEQKKAAETVEEKDLCPMRRKGSQQRCQI